MASDVCDATLDTTQLRPLDPGQDADVESPYAADRLTHTVIESDDASPSASQAKRSSDEILATITSGVEQRIGRQRFNVWFVKSVRLRLGRRGEGEILEIVVPDEFVRDWVARHFEMALREAAGETMGGSLELQYEVSPVAFERDGDAGLFRPTASDTVVPTTPLPVPPVGGESIISTSPGLPVPAVSAAETSARQAPVKRQIPTPGDSLRHDLDTFLVGDNNKLPYECCRSVADNPGGAYNPLFIHGGVGLGKTHLLQGLCRRYARKHPTGRWMYLTGEDFTNSFIAAVKSNRLDAFRRKLRDVDLLVIDDVHFLGGKRATQEEFLHTFNAIEAAGRHVVIASDAHPKTIASFGESLVSRFVSGMIARVDPPAREMREDLLRVLAKRRGVSLDSETTTWIASRVTQNVRELEGAVNRMQAHARLDNRRPDVKLAQEILSDLDKRMSRPVRAEQVFAAACDFFGLERNELLSGSRQRTIGLARSTSMYLVRKLTNLSYPDIAGRMGKRNHSTVISACRRVEASIKRNEPVTWTTSTGDRSERSADLVQKLEEHARTIVVD